MHDYWFCDSWALTETAGNVKDEVWTDVVNKGSMPKALLLALQESTVAICSFATSFTYATYLICVFSTKN